MIYITYMINFLKKLWATVTFKVTTKELKIEKKNKASKKAKKTVAKRA